MARMNTQALAKEVSAYIGNDLCIQDSAKHKLSGIVIPYGYLFFADAADGSFECDDSFLYDPRDNQFGTPQSDQLTARDYEDDTGFVDDGPWGQWDSSYKNRDDVFYP